jgi:ABC-type thiamin/hydroxymethylpyrimidine transport system permease subunit
MKAKALLKEVLASLGKFSIAGDFTKADCLLNVFQFITCEVGFVERDEGCQLSVIGYRLSVVGCHPFCCCF